MTTAQTTELRERMNRKKALTIGYRLPDADVAELSGLLAEMEELQERGAIDLPALADEIRLDIDDLFPIIEVLSVLKLANVSDGDITMTDLGRKFIGLDIIERKTLFARLLMMNIPLARHVVKVLKERPNKRAHENRFLTELEDHFTNDEAVRIFETFIEWARYAEIIEYDAGSGNVMLDETHL